MESNKLKLTIAGTDFIITTDDDPAYMTALAEGINSKISKLLRENSNISVTLASMLVALEYSDQYVKAEDAADNLRKQIKDYLEDTSLRAQTDTARREIERLKRENELLKAQLAKRGS